MPTSNFFIPWDAALPMSDAGDHGGILVSDNNVTPIDGGGPSPFANPDFYDNAGFRTEFTAAFGLVGRVRQWTLSGNIATGDSPFGWAGGIHLVLKACQDFRAGSGEIPDERFLCQFGGWYGEDGTATGTGSHAGEDTVFAMRFGAAWYLPGFVDENGNASETLRVTYHVPFLGMELFNGAGIRFGQIVTDIDGNILDNCPVVTTLPTTGGGPGFDRYGVTGFRMQLGGDPDIPNGYVSGALTLNPTLWWEHDAGDGLGPLYNPEDGGWNRTPPTR